MQACSLLSTVAEMLPWVHYLPHSEAEKQFRSQHILLSMFAFFFSFCYFSLYSAVQSWLPIYDLTGELSSVCSVPILPFDAWRKFKHSLNYPHDFGPYRPGVISQAAVTQVPQRLFLTCTGWRLDDLFAQLDKENKVFTQRTPAGLLILMSGSVTWNRTLHFSLGKLISMSISLKAHKSPELQGQFSAHPPAKLWATPTSSL